MKKFTYTCGSAFVLMLFFIISFTVYADEGISARLNGESYKAGDTVKVTVNVPENHNTAAFLLEVYYDSEKLSFKKTDNLSSCYMKSSDKDGSVSIAALAKSGVFSGDAFSLSFKLLDDSEENEIELAFRDLVDSNGEKSAEDLNCSLAVKPYEKPSGECELKKLVPSEGELNEEFSSDKYSYTMSVPYSVKSLSFDCTVSDGATYKINRKNLGSGGSTTDFVITVTAADGTKTEYTVAVTRGEYKSDKSQSSEKPNQTDKPDNQNDKNGESSSQSDDDETSGGDKEGSSLNSDAKLLSLNPSEGELNEEFSSDKYSYTMNVPYSVKSLSFDCTVSDGATYKVNRKNLGSGGSTTDFKITVTSADGKNKTEYIVSVTRGEYVRASGTKKGTSSKSSESEEKPLILSLVPSEGKLNEEFSSDVNNYTMNLPYDIKKLEFKVEVSDGASYTVNRTTLGKGGSTVDFKITVKSADGKSKNIYVISVTRGEKDETSSKSKSKKSESSKEYIEPETLAEYNAESKLTIVGDRLPGFIIVVFLTAMLVMLTLICIKIFRKK